MTGSERTHVVVTTIQGPTPAMRAWSNVLDDLGPLIVVGDAPGPHVYELAGTVLLTLEEQLQLSARLDLDLTLPAALPTGHYSRKNVGYLWALADGASRIYETDDDNAPLPTWTVRSPQITGRLVTRPGWCNAYDGFTDEAVWPRGLPLDAVADPRSAIASPSETVTRECVIQQGLADGSPDVDAIWRLTQDRPITFDRSDALVLGPQVWCPFNSQSTWWWPPAFPLLYLPSHCSFRMTDIWRSFVAQRCLWELGGAVAFHGADVVQERNQHDLMRDFTDEIPGYRHNREIARLLDDLQLDDGTDAAIDNLARCYRVLVDAGHIGHEELDLVAAWTADFAVVR